MPKLIDTHAHLEEIDDLKEALKRAKQAGVEIVVGVGADDTSNKQLLKICRNFQEVMKVYPALGLHPGNLKPEEVENALCFIAENINKIVAIGEIGLDYWYKEVRRTGLERSLQQEVFKRQLDLAVQYRKPIIVHSRGAWQDCLKFVAEREIKKAVFHWYSGPEDVLENLLNLGYLISATPSAEYSKEHRRAIEKTPLERILLETDSPVRYKPESGQYIAEPKDVLRTQEAVAKIKNLSEEKIAKLTSENAIKFFDL